jgi:hypothetical protein
VLLIHVAAYALAVAICAGINLWLSPGRLWFGWVALGWGIGLAAHGFAYWLKHTDRPERIFVDRRARGFAVHLFAYVAVIVLLLVINLTVTPNRWWFYWVALGWGAGIALHALLTFGRTREGSEDRQRPKRKAPAKKRAPIKTAPKKKAARPRKTTGG